MTAISSASDLGSRVGSSVFHVKHLRLSLAVIALALIVSGGVGLQSPEGWAAPTADGNRLFVQLERGTISAGSFTSAGSFSEDWRFPAETDDLNLDGFYATGTRPEACRQADYDGDGVGDACDPDPMGQ